MTNSDNNQPKPAIPLITYPKRGRFSAYRRFWVWFAIVFLLDQITKGLVVLFIDYPTYHGEDPVAIIPGFFYLVHIGNQGAAWGMLQNHQPFLLLLALLSLILIYLFRHPLELILPRMQLVFGMLCGGILGNVLDRIFYGHVVDFLDFHLPLIWTTYRWPAFNVADAGIVSGVVLYLFFSFKTPSQENKTEIK